MASAGAVGVSDGGGAVFVTARQTGGQGGEAFGTTADVGYADGGRGADSILVDAVSGSTLGTLSLRQIATGGAGGEVIAPDLAGDGGDALSRFEARNPGGGALIATSEASGGVGGAATRGFGGGTGGRGGSAEAAVSASGAADVQAFASARGGEGGDAGRNLGAAGDGGRATLGSVFGSSSGGGTVRVEAEARGGSGGSSDSSGVQNPGGSGASALVVDAVDGSSSGALELIQRAVGGDAGWGAGAPGGAAGSAQSTLVRERSAASLGMRVEALGGMGAGVFFSTIPGTPGGSATAVAEATNDGGDVEVEGYALGGASLMGGAASVQVAGRTSGDGHAVRVGVPGSLPVGAFGGSGGGDATSSSIGIASGDSSVGVVDRADGGPGANPFSPGGGNGGRGGTATSRASGENAGSSSVEVLATANGGSGGLGSGVTGGAGGAGLAMAGGRSSGGGEVFVTAIQNGGNGARAVGSGSVGGAGADSIMEDAVQGSSRGRITLTQIARGGAGGEGANPPGALGIGGEGGSARSTLAGQSPDGGALVVHSAAVAGAGASRAPGGSASATASGESVSDVSVEAVATGGASGADGGLPGGAAHASAEGRSTGGGDVSVTAIQTGGAGSPRVLASTVGAGGTSSMTDAVRGSTSGRLTLTQDARGGSAGSGGSGSGGSASSMLTASNPGGGALAVRILATGGVGTIGGASLAAGSAESAADVSIEAISTAGNGTSGAGSASLGPVVGSSTGGGAVSVVASAIGGVGGAVSMIGPVVGSSTGGAVSVVASAIGGVGGAASVIDAVDGTTSGALRLEQRARGGDGRVFGAGGAAVSQLTRSSAASSFSMLSEAVGGRGSDGPTFGGNGGNATGRSEGVASGGSLVVEDRAIGGDGGRATLFPATVGSGGDASSQASGGGGSAPVLVSSFAAGGSSEAVGTPSRPPGIGGDAQALAEATGTGRVDAEAEALAGSGLGASGTALARAIAVGSSGNARGEASASGGLVTNLRAQASAPVIGQAEVAAGARVAGSVVPATDTAGLQALGFASALPTSSEVDAALAGNESVAAGIAPATTAGILALIEMGSPSAAVSPDLSIRFQSSIEMSLDLAQIANRQRLMLGFLDPVANGPGMGSLRFVVEREGAVMLDESFDDFDAAFAFFDDHLIDLGALSEGVSGALDLAFRLELGPSGSESGFGFDFLVANGTLVPEPDTGSLLASGLVAMALLCERLGKRVGVRNPSRRVRIAGPSGSFRAL
jgi:hypothetical protein